MVVSADFCWMVVLFLDHYLPTPTHKDNHCGQFNCLWAIIIISICVCFHSIWQILDLETITATRCFETQSKIPLHLLPNANSMSLYLPQRGDSGSGSGYAMVVQQYYIIEYLVKRRPGRLVEEEENENGKEICTDSGISPSAQPQGHSLIIR